MKILCKKRYMKMNRKISKPETDNLTFIKVFCRNIKTGIKIPVYTNFIELSRVYTELWTLSIIMMKRIQKIQGMAILPKKSEVSMGKGIKYTPK